MATVDTLLVRIEADMSQLKKELKTTQNAVQQSVGKQKNSFNALGATIKGFVGIAVAMMAVRFAGNMVKMASSVEEMQAKSSVVFGKFTGQVRAELEEFGNIVGRSTFELEGMASSIQDTFVPMGFARGEAAKLSVDLTKLAVDVASFNNASDVDTMRAFQSALVGNHETVRRFGVVITEATLQQELQRMGITKNSKDVDNASKVQARMNLILAGTTDAHNDAANTAGSFANQSKALSAALDELIVGAVLPLLPALTSVVTGLVEATQATEKFLRLIGLIPKDLGTVIKQNAELSLLYEEEAQALDKLSRIVDKRSQNAVKNTVRAIRLEIKAIKDMQTARAMAQAGKDRETIITIAQNRELAKKLQLESDLAKKQGPISRKEGTEFNQGEFEEFGKINEATRQLAITNELLTMKINGKTEAEIKSREIRLQNQMLDDIQFKSMDQQIKKNIELTNSMDRKEESNKKITATNDKVISQLNSIANANEILEMKINGSTDAEIKKHQAMMANIGASPEFLAVLMAQIDAEANLNKELKQKNDLEDFQIQKKKDQIALAESLRTPMEELEIQQRLLNDAYNEGALTQEKYALGTDNIKLKMLEATQAGRTALDAINKVADSFSENFANALMTGELSLQSLGNTVKEVMAGLIRDFIKAQIRAMILKMILASLGMGAPSAGSFTGSGNLSGVGGYAGGGTVQGKTPIMVGERGPEMFIPNTGGVVRNASDTRSAKGGQPIVINQNLNISTGVAQTVRAEVMNMMPQISQSTIGAIVEAKQRGGAFATIMS